MASADFFIARQIRQRARHAHDAVEAACGEGEFFQQAAQGFLRFFLDAGGLVEFTDAQGGVDFALPRVLLVAGGDHARQHDGAAFPRFLLHQFGSGQAGDFDGQIDTVEQRAGNFTAVTRDAFRRAAAGFDGMPEITARTRVHGGDELEFGGIDGLARRTGNVDFAVFQRFAQNFQNFAVKLGQLVQK